MKKKPKFNDKERTILQALNKSRTGLTIYEIAQITGISWITVKKYIKSLKEKGVIQE
jgi:Fic family protein